MKKKNCGKNEKKIVKNEKNCEKRKKIVKKQKKLWKTYSENVLLATGFQEMFFGILPFL